MSDITQVADGGYRDHILTAEEAKRVDPWEALREWWVSKSEEDIDHLISKAQEYGGQRRANDLVEIGRTLVQSGVEFPADALGNMESDEAQAFLAELGIYFYLVGKFARWTAAVSEGRLVSDDTLHDIGIYVKMAQRVRAVGGWPI